MSQILRCAIKFMCHLMSPSFFSFKHMENVLYDSTTNISKNTFVLPVIRNWKNRATYLRQHFLAYFYNCESEKVTPCTAFFVGFPDIFVFGSSCILVLIVIMNKNKMKTPSFTLVILIALTINLTPSFPICFWCIIKCFNLYNKLSNFLCNNLCNHFNQLPKPFASLCKKCSPNQVSVNNVV